jgi:pyruvate,water dikinase
MKLIGERHRPDHDVLGIPANIIETGTRAVWILHNALIRVNRNPPAADRAVLSDLDSQWRNNRLPAYRQLVTDAHIEATTATPDRLVQLVDQLGREAGIYLWYLAIVGGSAWKMEACLTRFCRQHLAQVLSGEGRHAGTATRTAGHPTRHHSPCSADWYHPVAAELSTADIPLPDGGQRHTRLAQQRAAAEQTCRNALAGRPRLRTQFDELLQVTQRYAVIREEQARDFTLGWPVLRACVRRLGEHMVATGAIEQIDDSSATTKKSPAPFGREESADCSPRAGAPPPVAAATQPRRALDAQAAGSADRGCNRPRRAGSPR